jgi:thymidylate synthase (FAD)
VFLENLKSFFKIKKANMPEVELLEVFGSDLTVVNAARVSMGKESTVMTPGDAKLIKYLATHKHVSPFFHPQLRFRFKMPIPIAREWFRHTVGFSRNEISRRYVDTDPEFFEPTMWRQRNPSVKQGSMDIPVQEHAVVMDKVKLWHTQSLDLYKDLLQQGVCPEQARFILPQSMYTEFIETGSLYGYARLCGLRDAPDAQKEIRDYAHQVSVLLEKKFPVSWTALTMPQ